MHETVDHPAVDVELRDERIKKSTVTVLVFAPRRVSNEVGKLE
jgi:hypothetical protein